MTGVLYAIYLATGIFGLGVTIIDLLGMIGDHGADDASHDGGHGDAHDGGHIDVHMDAHADGHADTGAHGDADVYADAHMDAHADGQGDGHGGDHGDAAHGDVIAQHISKGESVLLNIMRVLRNLIYFCMGFGPTGFVALLMHKSALESLLWAGSLGVIILIGASLLRRALRKDLSSDISSADLLMESGEVIVTIGRGQMGKVRVKVDGVYVDRYAYAKDPEEIIKLGTTVRVVDSDETNIYVEKE